MTGPKPFTAVAETILDMRARAAYNAYLAHRPTCAQCQRSLFICAEGQELWDAYKAARGIE